MSEKFRLWSFEHRCLVREKARGFDLRRDVRELGLNRLKLGDWFAEGAPLAGVRERLIERPLGEAHAHRGDADPPDVQHMQELLEAGPARPEQVGLGHAASSNVNGRVSDAFQPSLRYGSPCS